MKCHRAAELPGLLLSVIAFSAAAAQQAPTDLEELLPTDPRVTVGTLENGIRYYIRVNSEPRNRAELRLAINAGSVLEDEDQLGLAHFVEHMAFNGTKHFEKQELVDYLEGIGMRFGPDLNAYTSFDETVYILKVPTDSSGIVETAFQILEDWARHQTFDHEQIDLERGVVTEEWRLGRGAGARMTDKQFPILFQGSRYAERLPIGKVETLENFDYKVLKRFYGDWYRPDLMAVVAVGDFDQSVIENLIKSHFSGIPAATDGRDRTLFEVPDHNETLFAVATDPEATNTSVAVVYKQPLRRYQTVGEYRQRIVERLYNSMLNARLFELTQSAEPPFIGASSGQGRFIRSKEFYVLSAAVQDDRLLRGLETLLTEGERVSRHGFAATELERRKRQLLRSVERAYAEREKTHSARYASGYVLNFLSGEPIPGIEYEYQMYQALVPGILLEEVDRLASEWITDANRVILVSAPEKESLPIPSEEELLHVFELIASKDIEPYEDSAPDAPLVADTPERAEIAERTIIEELAVTVWELTNGVRVILKPTDFKDDEILFRASSVGGTSLVSDEDYISASTAAGLIGSSGLGEFNVIELRNALAGKSVSVRPSIGSLTEGMSGRASPKDVETMFQLIYLYFTAPRQDSTAFLSYKSRAQAMLENRSASPISAFYDTVTVTLSQNHFRAQPRTSAWYEQMDLEDSFTFYQDRFADASDFTFAFVGTFKIDSIKPLVLTYLGGLPSADREETWQDVGIRPPEGVIRKTVSKGLEPVSRTEILFTGPFEWNRENRHSLRSMAEALQITLREILREDLGGTYSVNVRGSSGRDPTQGYTAIISFGSSPERLDELTQVVFAQVDSLKLVGPSSEVVDKVKEAQRRSYETNLRQNGYWLSRLMFADRYELDPANILAFEELIDSLTAEKIQEAAHRYLRTDNYVQVSLYPEGT